MRAGGIAGDQLRSIVERIERLEDDKKAIGEDISEIIVEAASNGFDVPTIRKVIRLRKLDKAEREKQEELLDLYLHALGMTSLEAAIERAGERSFPPERGEGKGGRASSGGDGGPPPDHPLSPGQAGGGGGDALAKRKRKARSPEAAGKAFADEMKKSFGDPVPLTEEEKAKGFHVAFIDKKGNRVAMGAGLKPRSPAAEFAADLAGA